MNTDLILRHTAEFFPRSGTSIESIERGGSDRSFFRVHAPAGTAAPRSLIVVRYGDERAENRHYVEIARFLADIGVQVPRIYFHDEEARLIGVEDLGERDLWSFREEPWERLRTLYHRALDQAALLHSRAHAALPVSGLTLEKEFDAALYLWEQDYFFENCLGRHLGIDVNGFDRSSLRAVATKLAALPRTLVHRDFQSQNIMIRDGEAYLIDFQGLRPGLPHYDVASLVCDPYVALPAELRRELVEYYHSAAKTAHVPLDEDFRGTLALCAMQRLMQALGAYGFLGIVKGRTHFLSHTPPALRLLREVAASIPGMDGLSLLLEHPAILAEAEKAVI
jgi:aminoglycoside/choline kinase family phosphotransferase